MKNILFYISGHGYGHAVRTKEVIRALLKIRNDIQIIIRTSAPAWIFGDLSNNPNVQILEAVLDPGVCEDDPLHINYEKTVQKLGDFLKTSLGIVYHETAYCMQNDINLIISDIPSIAGEIAARLDIPCIAMSNFLWDWIYEPMIIDEEIRNALLLSIRTGYSKMVHWIRYPFYHTSSMLEKITDVSLVIQNEIKPVEVLKSELNIPSGKKVVYIAFRGGINNETISRAAANARDYVFLVADANEHSFPENVYTISLYPRFSFADAINFADLIVGKPGYGLVSTCVGFKKPLLYPKRYGFREDEVLVPAISEYIPTVEIPHDNFFTGKWKEYLDKLSKMPMPEKNIRTDGAMESAQILNEYLG